MAPDSNATGRKTTVSKIKNPKAKKAISYAHDRRNTYGEAPHGARKSIPRGKARAHRAERHEVRQALTQTTQTDPDDLEANEVAETAVAEAQLQRLNGFRKVPDTPLGEVVHRNQDRRKRRSQSSP
jgi:hypothetical protein